MSRVFANYDNKITQAYKEGIHKGIDLVGKGNNNASCLDYIVAHSDGIVVACRSNYNRTDTTGNSYGNYIKIKHDNGMYTLYSHMKYGTVKVKVGERVYKGQIIGFMGNTGHSFGAHLHFEVFNTKDVKIDPTPYINANLPSKAKDNDVIEWEHTVKVGDTLSELAQKYNTTVEEIAALNGIKNVNRINVGQKLKIPSEKASNSAKVEESTPKELKLEIGDKIKLKEGATYHSGKAIPAWVFKSTLYYRGTNKNGVVFSTKKTGAVTGTTKEENIIKA